MTEEEAREWIAERFGEAAAIRIDQFARLVTEENERQNLIAPSTVPTIWARHIVDSAQLLALAPTATHWLDIGTGGGFPGMVVALLRPMAVTLVEPRRRRATFLQEVVDGMDLSSRVTVNACKVEAVKAQADAISARAVASVENLLHAGAHCATTATRWLLPRGRIDPDEIADIQRRWEIMFHVEPSLTNEESSILVLDRVRRR